MSPARYPLRYSAPDGGDSRTSSVLECSGTSSHTTTVPASVAPTGARNPDCDLCAARVALTHTARVHSTQPACRPGQPVTPNTGDAAFEPATSSVAVLLAWEELGLNQRCSEYPRRLPAIHRGAPLRISRPFFPREVLLRSQLPRGPAPTRTSLSNSILTQAANSDLSGERDAPASRDLAAVAYGNRTYHSGSPPSLVPRSEPNGHHALQAAEAD